MNRNSIFIQKWPGSVSPTEANLKQLLAKEGLTAYRWSNGPGDIYHVHTHNYHKVIFVVSGSITFGFPVEGEPTTLYPGDRLDLPAGIAHNAVVGSEGVVCLEAHLTS